MYSSSLMESSNVVVVTEGGTQSLWYTREKNRPDSVRAPNGKSEGGRGIDGVPLIAGKGARENGYYVCLPV